MALKANNTAKSNDLPPHVESYKKRCPEVAPRVSVERLGIPAHAAQLSPQESDLAVLDVFARLALICVFPSEE